MEKLLKDTVRKSRMPARLDFTQSATGLFLGIFMWIHMLLVCSIVLGKGAFSFVANMMEASFLSGTGEGYPILVFFAVLTILTIFIIHAALGMRKLPASYQQYKILRSHMKMMKHSDTNLWAIQAVTGFIMFFLGSAHLFIMLTNPGAIDTYLSADRVYSSHMWVVYLPLLFAVELHGTIGIYRVLVKWGWFIKGDPREARKILKAWKNKITYALLGLGVFALISFLIVGYGHRDKVGERYYSHGAEAQVEDADSETEKEHK
jgi:fumarate reductase subunit C